MRLVEWIIVRVGRLVERRLPYQRAVIVASHAGLAAFSYALAFALRFEFAVPDGQVRVLVRTLPLLLAMRLVVYARFHLYQGLWRYVGLSDLMGILGATALSEATFGAVALPLHGGLSRSVLVIDLVLCTGLVGGVRLALRALREVQSGLRRTEGTRALIVGAGDAAELLIRELGRNPSHAYGLAGIVDDDPRKRGRRIHGVRVVGTVDDIPALARSLDVQEILICVPSATREQRQRIVERTRAARLPLKTVPAHIDLLSGLAGIGQLRDVEPEDLLGRPAVRVDRELQLSALLRRRALVTGAGGSIGSELCRQIAGLEPELLVLVDRAESSLYFIDLELRRAYPGLKAVPVIADVADAARMAELMQAHAPHVVYHAAAYKHVPLMEAHPLEAVQNNVFGTEAVLRAALEAGAECFVLISTDKAVRPVNIMGMTKRVAEDLVLSLNCPATRTAAVRFGNVLGSDGSVLPLLRWQIATGGPLTVTDAEATRYFMLVDEAVQLLLQAGVMGRGGEVLFLDMGEPVRIMELAENLARMSGLEPGRDIALEVVGLRPGERLREQLVLKGEELRPSGHERILVAVNGKLNPTRFRGELEELRRLVGVRDREGCVRQLQKMAGRA